MSSEEVKTYTLKEIAEHSNEDSLWVLIDNSVYDVSKFSAEHPGGPEPLLEWAGKDATEAFEDIGHSSDAKSLMKNYKIGELSEEDRKAKNKPNETSSSCFWIQVLVPLGVVVTAYLLYKLYARYAK